LAVTERNSLEARLAGLADHLLYPPAPDLAGPVRAHLQARPTRRPWDGLALPLRRRAPAFALVAAVVAVAAVLGLSGAARRAVAGWLGLPGLDVRIGGPEPAPRALGGDLNLGRPTTLRAARAGVSFEVRVPEQMGAPDEVYVAHDVTGGRVSLVYRSGAGLPAAPHSGVGLLVTQFEATLEEELMQKVVSSGSRVDFVSVHGRRAYWISGAPHFLLYVDDHGDVVEETMRLAGNVLAWEEASVTVRLETALGRGRALEIARSMRRLRSGS